jgi:glutamate-ammonia-ligase adenylyltransferase
VVLSSELPIHRAPLDVSNVGETSFDHERAGPNLAKVTQRLSPALAATLPGLLTDSPDPESALILFDRLQDETTPEIRSLLNQHPQLAHYAIVIFGHSRFLGETLIQNPDILQPLLRPKALDQNLSRDEFRQSLARFRFRTQEKDVALLLARFKRREYIRILLRDVLRLAPLGETTAEISALSDVLLEEGLREASRHLLTRYDPPQHLDVNGRSAETPFAILSLGKLGGNELNYSSDIDLTYIFGDGPQDPKTSVSNREYFIRLAQKVTELLSRVTSEGPVFRIDLRLRPHGREGELAISLGQALRYYAAAAGDWERQALIKVRHSAGDAALTAQFIQGVQHHVYSEGAAEVQKPNLDVPQSTSTTTRLNFAAIKTALVAREKMQKHHRDAHMADKTPAGLDVKLESGGIRDIEFVVQCLQRMYGAREPWLRSGGTLASLHKLHDKRHISSREVQELTSAYEFLRHVEHRLQLREGRQTHHLPAAGPELRIVARSMQSFLRPEHRRLNLDLNSRFMDEVQQRMEAVAKIYQRIVYQQQVTERGEITTGDFQLQAGAEPDISERSGGSVLEHLARDAPNLYETATSSALDPTARKNLLRFLTSAFTSSERYAAVLRHADGVKRALSLFEMSDYLTDILVRHPEEIATVAGLADVPVRTGSGYLFESALGGGRAAVDPVFAYLASSSASHAEKMALLRGHFRHCVFAAGAKDILKPRSVYESLAETTSAAEDAIAAAWEMAGAPEGLAIMVLGRLGSCEFDLLSDADVIFVCKESEDEKSPGEEGQGQQRHDREALTRAASRVVQVLSAYTQEGMVFSTDTRLRPRGREGELLITPKQLTKYFAEEAEAWEALSFTKLRFVAGQRNLGERAASASRILFARFAADPDFPRAVRDMRAKQENADSSRNFKTSPGATYDIDFLCSFLLVKHGITQTGGTLRDRLWRCAAAGLLQKSDAGALDHAGELLRTVNHLVCLVVGRDAKWLPPNEHVRATVEKLTAKMLNREFSDGLEAEIDRTCREVRAICDRIVK